MVNDYNLPTILSVIAIIVAVGGVGFILMQPSVDVSYIEDTVLENSKSIATNKVNLDVLNINLRNIDLDYDYYEIEDIQDDIEDLEDDVDDIEDVIEDVEFGDVEDCYEDSGNWTAFKECLY